MNKLDNLTNMGKGRPTKPQKVRKTLTINEETVRIVELFLSRRICTANSFGDALDQIVTEWYQTIKAQAIEASPKKRSRKYLTESTKDR